MELNRNDARRREFGRADPEEMPRLEQLQALLAHEPNDLFLNFGLALELAKAERYEDALTQFGRVLELDPNYVAAYFHQGKVLLQMRDLDGARQALTTGIAKAQAAGDHHAKSQMEQLLSAM